MGKATASRESVKFIIAFWLPLLLISACTNPPPAPPAPVKTKHVHHAPPAPPQDENATKLDTVIPFPASAYILHLSLAELTLETGKGDGSAAGADFDIARAYSLQGQGDNVLQPAIIIEYALKDTALHRSIAIPFTMPKETSDFASLEEVMTRLSELSYTVYDLRLSVVTLPPPPPLPSTGDSGNAEKLTEDRLSPLIKSAKTLPPMAQARVYLQLARFFMAHKYKEPAYLAIENARQSLAVVAENPAQDNSEGERNLTREIDAEEALLHKTMPFTLNF